MKASKYGSPALSDSGDWHRGRPRRTVRAVSQLAPPRSCPVAKADRPAADLAMRRVLCIHEGRGAGEDQAHRLFTSSMALSGLRCVLAYVVFPIVGPGVGAATGVGPVIGIPVGVLALVFDVRGIRRFWMADHRWRWPITLIYLAVMGLVASLLAGDIAALAG